jgi:hypothetical protein
LGENIVVDSISKFVRSEFRDLDPRTLLAKPISVLLGVNGSIEKGLKAQHIETIFELASSSLFGNAAKLIEAAERPESDWSRVDRAPKELINDAMLGVPLNQLQLKPISALRSLTETAAGELSKALGVETIRDLVHWPPYQFSRGIMSAALGGDADVVLDGAPPADLLPITGRYPTERVQYETILLDKIRASGRRPSSPISVRGKGAASTSAAPAGMLPVSASIALEEKGLIDISLAASPDAGFQQVATGALLTFTQSWYTLGLSLGQLLHSLALAPGESTRIAVIDWTRRERAQLTDSTTETEALRHQLDRNRSIQEVTSAVATEMQSGSSASISEGRSSSGGLAILGLSFGGSEASSRAVGFSSSFGTRDIASEMTQKINDSTHQASSSTRNRWASSIREVSQSEHEELSTRAVTNYNHMHALTIQYYEVVQLYRTVVELARVTRCLFIPMKLVNFNDSNILNRFRLEIASAGLTGEVRALFTAERNMLTVHAPGKIGPWESHLLAFLERFFGKHVGDPTSNFLTFPLSFYPSVMVVGEHGERFEAVIIELRSGLSLELPWNVGSLSGQVFGSVAVDETRPWDDKTHGVNFKPHFPPDQAGKDNSFWDVTAIRLRKKESEESFSGNIQVRFGMDNFNQASIHPAGQFVVNIKINSGERYATIFQFTRTLSNPELQKHLMDNALYYSQAIWRKLDSATVGLLLSPYTFAGHPLLEVIDPYPLAVAGNYLVFRTYVEDDEWGSFLKEKKLQLGRKQETIVPLPSGGVFAEAVLGRANSAEKLDITRFWNWQDSPIPIQAPEIAALQAGSRSEPVNLKTGDLGTPVLNIVNPPSLPDPQGTAAILGAIQNGNIFRDMSGLTATAALAQSALERASEGARDAAAQAGQNYKTTADFVSSLLGGGGLNGGGNSQSPNTVSNAGARINHGKDLDNRISPVEANTQQPMAVNELAAYRGEIGAKTEPSTEPARTTQPKGQTGGEPIKKPSKPLPRTKTVRLLINSAYKITGEAFEGDFDLQFRGPDKNNYPVTFTTEYRGADGALVAGYAEVNVDLVPGLYGVVGRVMRTRYPSSATTPIPVSLAAGNVPLTNIDVSQQLNDPILIVGISGSFDVTPADQALNLYIDALEMQDEQKYQLAIQTTASAETEVTAAVEAEVKVLGTGGKVSGGVGVTVGGSLTGGETIEYTIKYRKLIHMQVRE